MMKSSNNKNFKAFFQEIGNRFRLPGDVKAILEINEAKSKSTYRVTYSTKREYIFQKVSADFSLNPDDVMKNIDLVTEYLKCQNNTSIAFYQTNYQKGYYKDQNGDYWRVRPYVDTFVCKATDSLEVIEDIGFAIGEITNSLKDFDVSKLVPNISNIHHTRPIIEKLRELDADVDEKTYLTLNIDKICFIYDLYMNKQIKQTVTFVNAKIRNLLFERKTRKPSIFIDIDMVQPGIGIYDFASLAVYLCNDVKFEDNKFMSAEFNLAKFTSFLKGYLKMTKFLLTDLEKASLGKALYAISCEAGAVNLCKYACDKNEIKLSKAKMYVALAKDIDFKKAEIEQIILKVMASITGDYKIEINNLDRDVLIEKQKDYKPGDYMDIVIPHNVKIKGCKAYAFFKRFFDIFCSLMALIVLSPLLIITGLIVKITSKGPIIYVSKRVGKNGRIFKFYKFRSMYKDADERLNELLAKNEVEGGITFKMKNDPRITPFGRFIRKTSIDELPQLINILKGDMSIIGPRVGLPREIELYPNEALDRLLVPQGLSGEWQANGRSNTTFDEMIKMDLDYIQNKRGFWYDISLIFKTIWVVIRGKGAE